MRKKGLYHKISMAIMKFFNEHEKLALSIVAIILLTMLAILTFELFYLNTEEVTTWEAYLKSYLSQHRFLR